MKKLKKETNNTAIKGKINLFRLTKENQATKDRIIRDIRNLFEHGEEGNYYKPVIFGVMIKLNMKVTMIEIKCCQFNNIFVKLDQT